MMDDGVWCMVLCVDASTVMFERGAETVGASRALRAGVDVLGNERGV